MAVAGLDLRVAFWPATLFEVADWPEWDDQKTLTPTKESHRFERKKMEFYEEKS